MYVYIIMLLISVLFVFWSEKVQNKIAKIILAIFSILPFILVSALRYDVGTDYMYRYVPDYNNIENGIDVSNLEKGYKLLVKTCLLVTNDYQILFAVTSIIIVSLFMITIYKNSKNKILSVCIFLLGGFFFNSLNILRQYIASGIIFFSYKFIFDKKYIKFGIALIIAFFIHSSSLICLILIILNKKEILNIKVLVVLALIIVILGTPILNLVDIVIENTRFSLYLDSSYNRGQLTKTAFVSNLIIYIFMYMLYVVKKKNNKITEEDKFFINLQGIAVIFMLLSSKFYLFFRIAYYFSIYQIISLPYFIFTVEKEDVCNYYMKIVKKILKKDIKINEKIKNNIEKIMCICIIAFLGIVTYHSNVTNNEDEVIPYKIIFERTEEEYIEDKKLR